VLGLLTMGYMTAIVSGYLPQDRRLDLTSLAILGVVAVGIVLSVNPRQLEGLKLLEMSGFRLEMQRVRDRQSEQATQLKDMRLMLPLLLPKTERDYLLKLASGAARDQLASHDVRAALRRLRSFDLIEMTTDEKHVGDLKDGKRYDLESLVKLTESGRRWAARITEIERGNVEAESSVHEADE
jgi:hypothetical protein